MDQNVAMALRALPAVDEVLTEEALAPWFGVVSHDRIVTAIRQTLDDARMAIRAGVIIDETPAEIAIDAAKRLSSFVAPRLRPVVNATGIIVHTNLGRSPLATSAIEAVTAVARGYSTLEYNLDQRERGSRQDICEDLLRELTGAEAALVVNNNAAAVLLALSGLAHDRDVVVSRGELIEIGGSFRIPDIMAASGATMVEVGTTNKTHPADFERAISDRTALLLKVHPSNYAIVGFSATVDAATLHELAARETQRRNAADSPDRVNSAIDRELLVYEDLGSGCLMPLDALGAHEPTVSESLKNGCDLVSFSGDKLLGGPQAGILVGRADLIERLRTHPLLRALRPDKMTLAALEATLRLYLNSDAAREAVPTLHMLSEPADVVRARAEMLAAKIEAEGGLGNTIEMTVVSMESCAGGGSLPLLDIPSYGLKLTFRRGSADDCQRFLANTEETPVIARIHDDALLFDLRTVTSEPELEVIAHALRSYATQ